MSQSERIARNLRQVRERIDAAAARSDRDPAGVTLVAVTKSVELDAVRCLRDLGITHFGENRVENARARIEALAGQGLVWHMIGNLQRRKVKEALQLFDKIDAVDRLQLADTIQSRCAELGMHATVLLEVNVSGETQKHGLSTGEVERALEHMATLDRTTVRGLMTMAPLGADVAVIRAIFLELSRLARHHGLSGASMGMSGDFELAVEAGATEIRVGSALFAP